MASESISSQAMELLNRNEFVAPFLRSQFVPYVPDFDVGVDFMLYRELDDLLFKVQLKGRWTVDRKYIGRGIWIAFRSNSQWYLVPHDRMVEHGREAHGQTASWFKGLYHKAALPTEWDDEYDQFEVAALLREMSPKKFNALLPAADVFWGTANDAASAPTESMIR
jgi:hypothetical protein